MKLIPTVLLTLERFWRGARRRFRTKYWSTVLKAMGNGCQICDGVLITDPQNISMGNNVVVNDGVIIQSCNGEEIVIGNHVTLSYGVKIITGGLILSKDGAMQSQHNSKPITIQDKVWIGANAVVLPGVNIGDGAVVGACSVVNRDVSSYAVVTGVPAKPIRQLNPSVIDS